MVAQKFLCAWTHAQTQTRTMHTLAHPHTHTPTHTITEMHSLAVFLAKAGYGTVAEMEETLKDMVGVGVALGVGVAVGVGVSVGVGVGVDVQNLGFRV
jgi:hypothetical protein